MREIMIIAQVAMGQSIANQMELENVNVWIVIMMIQLMKTVYYANIHG